MIVSSKKHENIKKKLMEFAERSHDLDKFAKFLYDDNIEYKDILTTNNVSGLKERYILVFTGQAGYEIIGLRAEINDGKVVVKEF